ncbi:hypothetical protein MCOR07_008028 [Pyricularia oryzae]|nr:hypothetical protein MCOR01_003272 [Pyricularia oryzae]KAI6254052.1 hypothetical protein MCOR19_009430 [Pyricularia oryzae]KAI6265506.1 hypothetical protein MCOR26_010699 [Pyricularia oryzae]KAI6468183.1 hypothetical protein MCOR17_004184 [Pyricularia oryzae]KAI6534381.1 hypothetical protein MCOR05_006393 [Pyricularia oryzae]
MSNKLLASYGVQAARPQLGVHTSLTPQVILGEARQCGSCSSVPLQLIPGIHLRGTQHPEHCFEISPVISVYRTVPITYLNYFCLLFGEILMYHVTWGSSIRSISAMPSVFF